MKRDKDKTERRNVILIGDLGIESSESLDDVEKKVKKLIRDKEIKEYLNGNYKRKKMIGV